jgi:hypothetical protein
MTDGFAFKKKQKQMTDGNAWKPLPHADMVQIHDMIQR